MDLRSGEKAATNRFRTRYRQTATAGTGDEQGARTDPVHRLADPERPGPGISEANRIEGVTVPELRHTTGGSGPN
jgi:hypothetical protein